MAHVEGLGAILHGVSTSKCRATQQQHTRYTKDVPQHLIELGLQIRTWREAVSKVSIQKTRSTSTYGFESNCVSFHSGKQVQRQDEATGSPTSWATVTLTSYLHFSCELPAAHVHQWHLKIRSPRKFFKKSSIILTISSKFWWAPDICILLWISPPSCSAKAAISSSVASSANVVVEVVEGLMLDERNQRPGIKDRVEMPASKKSLAPYGQPSGSSKPWQQTINMRLCAITLWQTIL